MATTIPTPLTVTDLDFDNILNNFKEYLKSQETFKDYNFEGSAISELLKLLSYNTFYNSFYVNNIANEMYLDSASERSAVVSRAKSLGYIPSSAIGSIIYTDLEVKLNISETANTVTLMPYASFSSSVQDIDYTFLTTEQHILTYVDTVGSYKRYQKKNVRLKEGKIFKYAYKVQDDYEKYIIPNINVDTSTLVVNVYPTSSSTTYTSFTQASNLTNISGSDTVFWTYEGEDQKYYLEFGNNYYGKKLDVGNIIYIEYLVCSGSAANGSKEFDINIGDYTLYGSPSEYGAMTATNSSYNILTLSSPSSNFSTDTFVRGETSNTTAYVYEYANNILKVYNTSNTFLLNEKVREEFIINNSIILGANGTIIAIKNESSYSSAGADIETINSIKFNSPKVYSSQNRLVTKSDYIAVLSNEFTFIDSIICWGGEEELPKQLGSVFVSIKPKSREYLTSTEKSYILSNIIEPKKMIGINVSIVDPDYIYIYPTIEVKYSTNLTSDVTKDSIINDVKNTIITYGTNNFNIFDNTFYYSQFVTEIDNSNQFILGNSTTTKLYKQFKPVLGVYYTGSNIATLKYSNPISNTSITSSTFTCNVSSVLKTNCHFGISTSNSSLLTVSNTSSTIISNAGTLDYANGIIYVSNVNITSTEGNYDYANNSIISIYTIPSKFDIKCTKNQILKIDTNPSITLTAI